MLDVGGQRGPEEVWRRARLASGLAPVVLSHLTMRFTPERAALYRRLVGDPHREWTIRDLTAAITPGGSDTGPVRATVYTLLNERVVARVAFQRRFTVSLTVEGSTLLRALLQEWSALHSSDLAEV